MFMKIGACKWSPHQKTCPVFFISFLLGQKHQIMQKEGSFLSKITNIWLLTVGAYTSCWQNCFPPQLLPKENHVNYAVPPKNLMYFE